MHYTVTVINLKTHAEHVASGPPSKTLAAAVKKARSLTDGGLIHGPSNETRVLDTDGTILHRFRSLTHGSLGHRGGSFRVRPVEVDADGNPGTTVRIFGRHRSGGRESNCRRHVRPCAGDVMTDPTTVLASVPEGDGDNGLTFADLRRANLARLPEFRDRQGRICHIPVDGRPVGYDWSLSQWSNAVCGELGEAANLIKKIERGDFALDEVRTELGDELCDVVTYLDILAHRAGIDLGAATVRKWNRVSEHVGSGVRLSPTLVAAPHRLRERAEQGEGRGARRLLAEERVAHAEVRREADRAIDDAMSLRQRADDAEAGLRQVADAVAAGGWCSGKGTSDPSHEGPKARDAVATIEEFYRFREEVWDWAGRAEAAERALAAILADLRERAARNRECSAVALEIYGEGPEYFQNRGGAMVLDAAIDACASGPAGDALARIEREKDYLSIDPFDGDFGDGMSCHTYRMVTTRTAHLCVGLDPDHAHELPAGSRARVDRWIEEGEGWMTQYRCVEALEADLKELDGEKEEG